MQSLALAFDMYGTLADPAGQAEFLRGQVREPERLAARWRAHQLEISWLLSLMESYEDWGAVTRYAFDTALAESGEELSPRAKKELLEQARVPALFDEVRDALVGLKASGYELAVFSNGTRDQLTGILKETRLAPLFSDVISVDDVGVFKPAPAVYQHAAQVLEREIGEVWLVSGNPFDAAGGKKAGMRVAKIERGPSFRYPFVPEPDLVAPDLAAMGPMLPPAREA